MTTSSPVPFRPAPASERTPSPSSARRTGSPTYTQGIPLARESDLPTHSPDDGGPALGQRARRRSSVDFFNLLRAREDAQAQIGEAGSMAPIVEKVGSQEFAERAGKGEGAGRKILLGYDNTPESRKTLTYVRDKVARPGDHLLLTTILPMSLDSGIAGWVTPSVARTDNQIETELLAIRSMREKALETLREVADELFRATSVTTTLYVLHHAEPRVCICRVAEYHKVDLVVVGRRPLGGVKRALTAGACSSYVLVRSPAPVLIVK